MKLEVGKKYNVRDSAIIKYVEIVSTNYLGCHGRIFYEDTYAPVGSAYWTGYGRLVGSLRSSGDLVSEYITEQAISPFDVIPKQTNTEEHERIIRELERITGGWDNFEEFDYADVEDLEEVVATEASEAPAVTETTVAVRREQFRDCNRGIHSWDDKWRCTGCGISEYDHQLLKGGA